MLKITGTSVLPKEKVKAYLLKKNVSAPVWLVDLYYDVEVKWGIRADVLLCQSFFETGYLSSWWSAEGRRNLAGIGITGETSKAAQPGFVYDEKNKFYRRGLIYTSYMEAVMAHFAHLSAYVNKVYIAEAARWDSRYDMVFKINSTLALTVNTIDLNGNYTDGANYGQSIEGIYNAIAKS